ncbi:MAG: YicC family protein [Candidatus Omnitrophica bacterium]|nr:YicC family protein [Candidatus Omnitrophota bacterium]
MTGYSRATRRLPDGSVTVELRSTNHRYFELSQRLPDGLVSVEGQVAQLIRRHLRRGRVELTVSVQAPHSAIRRVTVDEALMQAYHTRLRAVARRLGVRGDVTLEHLLSLPQLVSVTEDQTKRQALWADIRRAIQEALRALVAMRRAEGRRLAADIRAQAGTIARALGAIRRRLPQSAAQQRQRLQARLEDLLSGAPSSTLPHVQEALAVVRDTDINEELVRLESHLTHLRQALASREPVGKKLDFIAQELTREANTLGAKADDAAVARAVIEIKGAIERIREQAQNLE